MATKKKDAKRPELPKKKAVLIEDITPDILLDLTPEQLKEQQKLVKELEAQVKDFEGDRESSMKKMKAAIAQAEKECAAAKRHGAVTIWLNEQAAAAEGNLESTGFLGAAIINDFADALCAGPGALRDAIQEAQLAAAAKAAEEEARAEREHYADLADEAAMLSPRWDAKAALPTRNGEEATSIFAMPADDDGNGLDLFSGGAQRWVASGGEAQTPPPATPPPPPPSGAAAQQQKFCTECGAKLPQSAKFCSACGSPQE